MSIGNRTHAAVWVRVLYGAIFLVALIYSIAPPWGPQADIWETSAAIQAVSDSPLHPRNPLLDLPGDTSPRFTPYTVVWGVVDKLSGLELFTTVAIAGLFNLLLFLTGLSRVVRTLTGDRNAFLWIVPVMLIGWGHGYGEANGYQAELFFASLPYVGMFTYGLCFHGIAELNRYLESGARSGLVAYALIGIAAFLTHPITAMMLFVGAFAWAATRTKFSNLLLLQIVPLIALASSWLWPYFDYPTLLFRGTSEDWYQVRLFDHQISKVGPALLGILVAGYFALRKRHLEVVIALGCSLAIYLASWALGIQIGSRFIFYGAIFAHMCIGLFLWESGLFRKGFFHQPLIRTALVLLLAAAVFVPGLYYRAHRIQRQWVPAIEHYERTHGDILEPWDDLGIVFGKLDDTSVVMVEDTVGWRIPAMTGARLVAQAKGDPLIQDEVNRRRSDVTSFFDDDLETGDRLLLLTKYHCTHVLVDERHAYRNSATLKRDLGYLSIPAMFKPPYRLYKVKDFD
ncbi:MAG: hypothetical protein KDB65_11920 [Calditrichaeota bacterium]|nr:hypothetical protein [Calditrichota bacterium]MCB9368972.1 hypothetical protein [Calditrichota bacterium]